MSAVLAAVSADSEDLEALFDSIVQDKSAREAAPAEPVALAQAPVAATTASPMASDPGESPQAQTQAPSAETAGGDVMSRIGSLTRQLHDALRELGYHRPLEKTAAAIPDARDRLDYVVKMTEQAALRALNAIEAAQPIQDRLGADAERLAAQWQQLFDRQLDIDQFKTLVSGTRDFLAEVPRQSRATNAHLLEIMMAQDFQDLTGQVIKKITSLAQNMEQQLVHLLVDMAPDMKMHDELDTGLLNGPVVNAEGRNDVVTNQDQVDDLLESLGF